VSARTGHVEHLYVHLPFCAHRCGYCDFVTAVGRHEQHEAYVDGLLAELELERDVIAPRVDTVFLGGGTPTFTRPEALARLLQELPEADELTVEANPETVTPEIARLLLDAGVTRVSLGAQSFRGHLLEVLERRATPEVVREAVYLLRDAGVGNISLDLLYGIPGQSSADLAADLADAVALQPEHLSCYELEAKPGTRFTHAHGAELARQAEAMEGYFEHVVDTLTASGYRWYETSNFCLERGQRDGRDLRARHNLAYWQGQDYLGIGVGAVSTVAGVRWRNAPSVARYLGSLANRERPPREVEQLDDETRARERLLLGLRLDEALPLDVVRGVLDEPAARRLQAGGLVKIDKSSSARTLALTRRGRFLGGGVTAELTRLDVV
jgi:oxygen-independent coproporphyrinogen-3 oxidase